MSERRHTPGLDRPAIYEIRVRGRPDDSWTTWMAGMSVAVEAGESGTVVTVLTGAVEDQAALQGLLGYLYGLGLTLVSVNEVEAGGRGFTA